MASTSRSASPSSEGDYDILTPTGTIPNAAKQTSRHEKFGVDIASLERWAPTVGRLHDHEIAQLSRLFGQKMNNLANNLPTGTEDQLFEALERLIKLRDGPLGIRMHEAMQLLLDVMIDRWIEALSGQGSSVDYEVRESTW